jgi:hypothetical protein
VPGSTCCLCAAAPLGVVRFGSLSPSSSYSSHSFTSLSLTLHSSFLFLLQIKGLQLNKKAGDKENENACGVLGAPQRVPADKALVRCLL